MKRTVLRLLLVLTAVSVFAADSFARDDNGSGVRVIVIDAGHGGKAFPGAVYGGVKEKDINLAVALKLGALLEKELPHVRIVYTRKTDTALGKTLNDDLTARANTANKAGGDFFISIHANAAPGKPSVKGAETIIMGESEKETRYNESALYNNNKDELIDMSDENTAAMVRAYIQNLQFTYGEYSEMMARIMQSHYAKGGRNARRVNRQLLKVLYATDMPSVLTELGFMTNPGELAFMNSEKGQAHYARILCDAVKEYVGYIDKLSGGSSAVSAVSAPEPEPAAESDGPETVSEKETAAVETAAAKPAAKRAEPAEQTASAASATKTASGKSGYTIQLLASDKAVKTTDSQFKSYRGKVRRLSGGGVLKYKYCYGEYSTAAEANRHLAEVRRSFKDAFVVRYEGDRIAR